MDIQYRQMQANDYHAVHDLWAATPGIDLTRADSERDYSRFLDRNPGFSYVAFVKDELIGAVLCGHDGRRGFLHHLSVSTEFHRQGIASQLVELCMDSLKARGIEKCHLFIRRDNTSGLDFWTSTGWLERTTLTMASRTLDDLEGPEDPNSC